MAALAVVVEAVDDVGREDDERPGRKRERPVAQVERELALDDEEGVRVLAVDVQLRSALAGAVVELGDGELVGLDEHGRAAPGPVGDRCRPPRLPSAGPRRARDRPTRRPPPAAGRTRPHRHGRSRRSPSPVRGGRGTAPVRRRSPRPRARPGAGRMPSSPGRPDARDPRAGARALPRSTYSASPCRAWTWGGAFPQPGAARTSTAASCSTSARSVTPSSSRPKMTSPSPISTTCPQPSDGRLRRAPLSLGVLASSTGHRSPRSSRRARPSSGTTHSPSPTTTASTARSSSRTRRRRSACGRSRAPR